MLYPSPLKATRKKYDTKCKAKVVLETIKYEDTCIMPAETEPCSTVEQEYQLITTIIIEGIKGLTVNYQASSSFVRQLD